MKKNIKFIGIVIAAQILGLTTIKFMNKVYEIELNNQKELVQQHLEYINNNN